MGSTQSQEPGPPSRPKVLIVEPDATLADQLCYGLAKEGIPAKAAQTKEQASIRAELGADVVLVDFDDPDPAGLIALLRAVENTKDASIIALTSTDSPGASAKALQAGADDCIGKPEIAVPGQTAHSPAGMDLSVATARIRREIARRDAQTGATDLERKVNDLQERLSLILSGTNDGVWDWDLRDNKVHYSPRWREISGCPNAALTDSPEEWLSRVHPDDRGDIRLGLQSHWNDVNSREFQTEYRMITDDGSYRWLVCRAVTLRDSTGQPLRMAGSQSDVTLIRAFDFLTGLPNRLWLTEALTRILDIRKRHSGQHHPNTIAVVCIGLDRFRSINEAFGHSLGDELLLAVARRLRSSVRSASRAGVTDIVARLGGDEFALVVNGEPSAETVLAIAERVLSSISEPFMIQGREIFTSASAGVALADEYCASPEDLLRDADIARNQAKGLGRSRCIVYDQHARVALIERADLENDLRHAVARNELRLFYQPIVSIADARPVGFEALVRWKHPVRGMIPPVQFISLAEETGLIVPMGSWILNEACRKAKWWHDLGYPLEVNVNLSPRQLRDGRFVHTVEQAILQSGLAPAALHLEITETQLIENFPEAKDCLAALKNMGVGIKIDDFGVGYSSLGYLHRFQVDALKIDRSFVNDMSKDQACLGIVRTVVLLARGLGVKVVAEGVETEEQAAQLMTLGCELAQGFYFKKPMPAEDLRAFLEHPASMVLVN